MEKAKNKDIGIFKYVRLNYVYIKDKARNKYLYLLKALEDDFVNAIDRIKLDFYS